MSRAASWSPPRLWTVKTTCLAPRRWAAFKASSRPEAVISSPKRPSRGISRYGFSCACAMPARQSENRTAAKPFMAGPPLLMSRRERRQGKWSKARARARGALPGGTCAGSPARPLEVSGTPGSSTFLRADPRPAAYNRISVGRGNGTAGEVAKYLAAIGASSLLREDLVAALARRNAEPAFDVDGLLLHPDLLRL